MIWVHEQSSGNVQNMNRNVVIKIDENNFVLKKESEVLESDTVDFPSHEYFEWLAEGNEEEMVE
jgi:hypothetical protein